MVRLFKWFSELVLLFRDIFNRRHFEAAFLWLQFVILNFTWKDEHYMVHTWSLNCPQFYYIHLRYISLRGNMRPNWNYVQNVDFPKKAGRANLLYCLITIIVSRVGCSLLTRSRSIMPDSETCIRFGNFGARVMIEDKETQHYSIHVDPAKKEVSCWIASEAGKVREYLFAIDILFKFFPKNLGL